MSQELTADTHGDGRPRLIFAMGGEAEQGAEPREFELGNGVTTIGSGEHCDLRLDGLDEHHAEIRPDDHGEYVYLDPGSTAGSRVNGQPADKHPLHAGDRLQMGPWTVSFYDS